MNDVGKCPCLNISTWSEWSSMNLGTLNIVTPDLDTEMGSLSPPPFTYINCLDFRNTSDVGVSAVFASSLITNKAVFNTHCRNLT